MVDPMSRPAKSDFDKTCPRCDKDAATTWTRSPDGGYLLTCYAAYAHGGDGLVTWTAYPTKGTNAPTGAETEGVTTNLVDPLLTILQSLPDAWIEYGVIEYELRLRHPELFGQHVAERGHYLTGSGQATASSVRFSTALVRLFRRDIVDHRRGPATGAWKYNGEVEYWTLRPVTDGALTLTWADYAENTLRRTADWTDEDRAAVAALAGR
jgi:hypothetical protein